MIRKTLDTDIPAVMAIYDAARAFMRAQGDVYKRQLKAYAGKIEHTRI